MSKIVVTGSAGFIGGQVVLNLLDAGHEVIGVDLQPMQYEVETNYQFLLENFASDTVLDTIVKFQPDAIVHCAGTSLVGPSMTSPQLYYRNNVVNTIKLLDIVIEKLRGTRVIFSSSAATYGEPIMTPCQEVDPCEPISPYGESKLMIERIMRDYHRAYNLDYVAFRFFNACGADSQARHGQTYGATHVIARVLEATRDNGNFIIYGDDYPTADGTCVRDYVHVEDIARAHALALNRAIPAGVYNLGSDTGTSVKEIINKAQTIVGKTPNISVGASRDGDPPILTASADKFQAVAGAWRQYQLDDMIQHAWAWYNK